MSEKKGEVGGKCRPGIQSKCLLAYLKEIASVNKKCTQIEMVPLKVVKHHESVQIFSHHVNCNLLENFIPINAVIVLETSELRELCWVERNDLFSLFWNPILVFFSLMVLESRHLPYTQKETQSSLSNTSQIQFIRARFLPALMCVRCGCCIQKYHILQFIYVQFNYSQNGIFYHQVHGILWFQYRIGCEFLNGPYDMGLHAELKRFLS